jgi:hypothetical protein
MKYKIITPKLLREAANWLPPDVGGLCWALQDAASGKESPIGVKPIQKDLWNESKNLFLPDHLDPSRLYLPVTPGPVGQQERFMYAHFLALFLEGEKE